MMPNIIEEIPTEKPSMTPTLTATKLVVDITNSPTISKTPKPTLTSTKIPTQTRTPLPTEITDAFGVEMVLVPEGEFTMGSDDGYFGDEKPAHIVSLDTYYIDKYEVSNVIYKACVDIGICEEPKEKKSSTRPIYYGNNAFDDFPVIYIDWYMANAFCEWRGLRLPSEAEWEKAARGTDGRIYPWGNWTFPCDFGYANYHDGEKYCVRDTALVYSREKGKSIYGVYNMIGNVQEWVGSLYKPYPYNANDGREDLKAIATHIIRGGAYNNYLLYVNTYSRFGVDQSYSGFDTGFRCAKDATP